MTWFKVDDHAAFNAKVVRAGNAAFGAWVRIGSYCCAQLNDGRISEEIAKMIATKKELVTLLQVGMLHQVDGGYEVHDFLEYQKSREQVEAEREVTRKRVQRFRNGVTNGVSNGAPLLSDPILSDQKKPTPPSAPLELVPDRFVPDLAAAYALYPRKEGKSKAMKKLQRTITTPAQYERFVASIKNYAKHVIGRDPDKVKQFDSFVTVWEDYADGLPFAASPPRAQPHEQARPKPPPFRKPVVVGGDS